MCALFLPIYLGEAHFLHTVVFVVVLRLHGGEGNRADGMVHATHQAIVRYGWDK